MNKPIKLRIWGCLMALSVTLLCQAQMDRITVLGNEFVDEAGDVFIFRGYSSSDPDNLVKQNSWNQNYFDELKRWGANVVRFPIHPRAWRSRGKENYLKLLDQGIQWAAANDMYVIMDWHSIGNLTTGLYLNDGYYTDLHETFAFWKVIAERYGDNSTVAFYELFNEPTSNGNKFGRLNWEDWKSIMEELIVVVRANGGEGIPLVAGFNWAYDLTPVREQPIDADGIAYVSHPYPQKKEKPWFDKWTNDWGFVKETYPIVLTEIGYCAADDPGAHIPVISDQSYGEAITEYSDQNNISYIVWVFDNHWAPRLYVDDKYTPAIHGAYWKDRLNKY